MNTNYSIDDYDRHQQIMIAAAGPNNNNGDYGTANNDASMSSTGIHSDSDSDDSSIGYGHHLFAFYPENTTTNYESDVARGKRIVNKLMTILERSSYSTGSNCSSSSSSNRNNNNDTTIIQSTKTKSSSSSRQKILKKTTRKKIVDLAEKFLNDLDDDMIDEILNDNGGRGSGGGGGVDVPAKSNSMSGKNKNNKNNNRNDNDNGNVKC